MSEERFKRFEKEVFAFLSELDFSVGGYYTYQYYTDILGYLKPRKPFTIPTRVMVEIIRGSPTPALLESFAKLAKDSLSERALVFAETPRKSLKAATIAILEKYRLEYLDVEQVANSIAEQEQARFTAAEIKKITDVFSAPILAKNLSEIAMQRMPKQIERTATDLGLKPWQVFEQAVFSIFHYCFSFTVRKYGEDSLFEHEPEGVAITNNDPASAFIYECKSSGKSYKMTAQDELTYKDYIKRKKEEISVLDRAHLKYFVIISPDFAGDIMTRREEIYKETQVLPIFLLAKDLSVLANWACDLPNDVKKLIHLDSIFSLEECIVSRRKIDSYIKEFENKTRRRY